MIKPEPGMKIRWRNVYYPLGEWLDENGEQVEVTTGFRALFDSIKIIVMMGNASSAPGHGEPSITAMRPSFINEENLERIDIGDKFITITQCK